METILIDEKEIVYELVEKVAETNKILLKHLDEKEKNEKFGPCLGGLEVIPCSKGLSLQSNIKNILAIFRNNYYTSLFFQIEAMKQKRTLELLRLFLTQKGLLEEFEKKHKLLLPQNKTVNIRIE